MPALTFPSIVGQEPMKLALVLMVVNPATGGVIIRGERGTGKSTAIRALHGLLPLRTVVAGCPWSCGADDPAGWCDGCRQRAHEGPLPTSAAPMRVVELPLNASEDRVVGSLDLEAAVRRGEKRFEPGILARAHGNLLYIDEVNLLDDHIVDILLDAAAMGHNTVERDGISVSHPARCLLVGTMNPEEGELRPQLLDRFGLCVDVAGLTSLEQRVRIMEQVHASGDTSRAGSDERHLREAIVTARAALAATAVPAPLRRLISVLCVGAAASGHRADLVITNAARAHRAWQWALAAGQGAEPPGRMAVTVEDVLAVEPLAMAHRRRDPGGHHPEGWSEAVQVARERERDLELSDQAAAGAAPHDPTGPVAGEQAGESGESGSRLEAGGSASGERAADAAAPVFDGTLFAVRSIQLPRGHARRRISGKRRLSPSADRRGRYVGSTQLEHPTDVALDATLRSAAPHQRARRDERAGDGVQLAVHIEPSDVRQKVRKRRTGTFIVFVVDASASMDAEQRMHATKGAVLSLLRDAYIRRDKVSLVIFSGRTARVVLQPTSSVDLAESRLQRLSVGGTTPLTHGLAAGLRLIRSERLRDPGVYPLLVLISDGRGNISLYGDEPLVEAQTLAARLAEERVQVLVIDSARDHRRPAPLPRVRGRLPEPPPTAGGSAAGFNPCQDLARRAGGEYLGLFDLSQGAIVDSVARTLRGR